MRGPWCGRLVDEHASAHVELAVCLEDVTATPNVRIAQTWTDARGEFSFEKFDRGLWTSPSDIVVVAYDPLGLRPLRRFPLAVEEQGDVGDLCVPRTVSRGWRVTTSEGTPLRLTQGNAVSLFVDDEAFAQAEQMVRRAQRSIDLAQLWFDDDFTASPPGAPATPLLDLVLAAAQRGVRVRVLLNENAVLRDSVDELRAAAASGGDGRMHVKGVPMSPNVMHMKILAVDDDEILLIGPPFQQQYWDTEQHRLHEPRRGARRGTHDLALRIRGPALAHVQELFEELWNADVPRGDEGAHTPRRAPPPAGNTTLQVVRTVPPGLVRSAPGGETSLLHAYLRAIAEAEDYLYFEAQYFTSPTIAEAIARALRRRPALQAILLLNEDTDVPTYIAWQKRRLREMGYPGLDRLGVFALRNPHQVYVHSKVALADDAWATVGTANLDSLSLETSDEFGTAIDPNVDVNVVLLDGVDGAPATGDVTALRRRLWAEHLGDERVWAPDARPAGGWLSVWQEVAEKNVELVRQEERPRGHVVPYLPPDLKPPSDEP